MNRKTEALLCCLRTERDGATAARLQRLSYSDWDSVIAQSAKHDVTPLVYHRIKTLSPRPNIPEAIVQRLRDAYLSNCARNLRIYHELSKVLTVLRSSGIRVIVMKGAHLAELIYGDIAVRPMADVDLLVREEDLSGAAAALDGLEYTIPQPQAKKKRFYLEKLHHLAPYSDERGYLKIEVHRSITPPSCEFQIDLEGIWRRSRPARVANVEVLVLSPEDLILHLSFHASFWHEFGMGLRPLCDISEAVHRYQNEIDWNGFLRTVNKCGIGRFLHCALLLTRRMLGAPIPNELLRDLEPANFDSRIVGVVQDYLLAMPALDLPLALQNARRTERTRDRILTLLRSVFPSPEKIREIYYLPKASTKAYLYYLIRPLDIMQRKGKTILHLALRTKQATQSLRRDSNKAAIERWVRAR